MKHLRKFNESANYDNLLDIIEDRFILKIADEYQLKEYSFDIFRKNGSTSVYKDDLPNANPQALSNYTQYNDGYCISRRFDGIYIQLFFEMKSTVIYGHAITPGSKKDVSIGCLYKTYDFTVWD
jgi:hypothetical protein